jgi:cytochrome c oxidase assembly protein subunit 15
MPVTLHRLAVLATLLAFLVIVLGAWVRLSHAGLGCPDWPGCYGHITWPDDHHEVSAANLAFPERPVESHKAWREMLHRYLAGALVLLVLAINVLAWRGGETARRFRALAFGIGVLILFQAALGMWTVTLKLLPWVVSAHLLGGMATFGLLLWLGLRTRYRLPVVDSPAVRRLRRWLAIALVVLVAQISLGGWTTANYAALACPDLPRCTGEWWPQTDFAEAFVIWREVGVNYEGGILDQSARAAIHLSHRIGAVITLAVLLFTGFLATRVSGVQRIGKLLMALVCLQFLLGLLNVALQLPLPNAVAHNGTAALLLGTLLWALSASRTSSGAGRTL